MSESATTGLVHRSKPRRLFDHLVCNGEHARRNGQAKRLGGFKINHQLELGRLQDWQVGRLLSLENPACIEASETIRIGKARSVADQTTCRRELAILIDRRHTLSCCQRYELFGAPTEEFASANQERAGFEL